MAAIFCQALSKPCEWTARCCTAMCNGLTRGCGEVCSCCGDVCAALGSACAQCCGALSNCCASACDCVSALFNKPFSGLVFLAVMMSVAPFAALIYFLAAGWGADGCAHPLHTWLLVTLIMFVVNFIFALYLSARLSKEHFDEEDRAAGFNPADPQEVNEYRRAKTFFLYDPFVCLFICAWMFELAWGIVGLTWVDNSPDCRSDSLRSSSLAAAIILLVFVCIFLLGCFCSLYSGFLAVCLRDCDVLKCCCCWFYYPFMYSHEKAKERQLQRQGLAGRNAQQQQRPLQGGDRQQQQQLRNGQAPPQQYGVASPVAQQNLGGNIYHQPVRLNNQPQAQQRPVAVAVPAPVYSPPVSYAPAPQQAPMMYHPQAAPAGVGYQPPAQHMPQAYQPQPAPYQPPPQFSPIGPVYAQMPPPQQQAQQHSYQQSPPPSHQSPVHYEQQHAHAAPAPVDHYGQQEGVPHGASSGGGGLAPGGAPFVSGNVSPPIAQPVAQPVAQPIARAQPQQQQQQQQAQQPQQQGPVARAADGAKAAAASLKGWLGKK